MSIEDIEKKQIELQRQLLEAKEHMMQVEAQLQIVYAEIQRQKIAQSSCQEQYTAKEVDLEITQESAPPLESDRALEMEIPKIILPKPLEINGFTKVEDFLYTHVVDLVPKNYNDHYQYYYFYIVKLARSLSLIGKELIFERIASIDDNEMLKEWRGIIDTCEKIIKYKKNNDKQGYTKMTNFFYQKYPKPINPFDSSTPVDLFIQVLTPYSGAYHLMYYLQAYYIELLAYNKKNFSSFEHVFAIEKAEINDNFLDLMKMLYMLFAKGWKIAIVPILDENIIYRPKRVAQDGKFFSLYYYEDYVEEPQMVTEEGDNSSVPSYYASGGSTFVNGHYRSGYWRNGRYVSGGYVKGHYRS